MNDPYNRNTRLYEQLIIDVVNSLRETPWTAAECDRIFLSLPDLHYGVGIGDHALDTLEITFTFDWSGNISVVSGSYQDSFHPDRLIRWDIGGAITGLKFPRPQVMLIGGLQEAFRQFHHRLVQACSRQLQNRSRGSNPYMSGDNYFADLAVRTWLESPKLTISVARDELVINDYKFRTGRTWRRDVRASVVPTI